MAYPSLTFAQLLDNTTRAELEQFVSLLQGYLSQQHDEDGAHTDVTATSIVTTGDGHVGGNLSSDGSIVADADGDPITLATDSVLGTYVRLEGSSSDWMVAARPTRTLAVRDVLEVGDAAMLDIIRTGSSAYDVRPHSSAITLTLGTDASGQRWSEVNGVTVRASGAYYERGRTAAMGEWTTPAYSAGDFTADSGSWTVDSGDVLTYAYAIVGKRITVSFEVATTDVSATPTYLKIKIPGGFTAAKNMRNPIVIIDAGGTAQVGMAFVTGGETVIRIYKDPTGTSTWTTTSSDNTYALGQITFEVS